MKKTPPAIVSFLFAMIFLVGISLATSGCSSSSKASNSTFFVRGKVEVIGTAMKPALLLTTPDRNSYLLEIDDKMADEITAVYPKTVVVSGELYLGEWVGEKQACIKVEDWNVVN